MTPLYNAFKLPANNAKELENYKFRLAMMNKIVDLIKHKNWTRTEACDELEISNDILYDLQNDKINSFSEYMLLEILIKHTK